MECIWNMAMQWLLQFVHENYSDVVLQFPDDSLVVLQFPNDSLLSLLFLHPSEDNTVFKILLNFGLLKRLILVNKGTLSPWNADSKGYFLREVLLSGVLNWRLLPCYPLPHFLLFKEQPFLSVFSLKAKPTLNFAYVSYYRGCFRD